MAVAPGKQLSPHTKREPQWLLIALRAAARPYFLHPTTSNRTPGEHRLQGLLESNVKRTHEQQHQIADSQARGPEWEEQQPE